MGDETQSFRKGREGARWIACLWLPYFAVRAERARRPELGHRPLALVACAEKSETPVLRACSPEALAAGYSAGTPVQAMPQHGRELALLPYDTRHYEQRYEELLEALDAVTPQVEAQPLEVFYLDLSGLTQLDPEAPEQVAAAVQAVLPPPFSPRIGVASDTFTAWAAAHFATQTRPLVITEAERAVFLRQVPSALLPVSAEMARRLDLLGLRTLGRIAQLPRSAMLAQFGRAGERAHRLACGEERQPLTPHTVPPVIRERLTFPMPAPTAAEFDMALLQLVERVCARPERRGQGVRQVRLLAALESGGVWERSLTLRRPYEHAPQIFNELRLRLETARPVGILTDLTVELTAFAVRLDRQRLLFPDERQHRQERLAEELRQLWERYGRSSVFRIVEVEPWSRLPEKRHALLSCDT